MATEYLLQRADGAPLGSFEDVAAYLQSLFPSIEFAWTPSGAEKLAALPPEALPQLRQVLERMPSLLEGTAEGEGFHVVFNLGFEEPVTQLFVVPLGEAPELLAGLEALAAEAEAEYVVSRED